MPSFPKDPPQIHHECPKELQGFPPARAEVSRRAPKSVKVPRRASHFRRNLRGGLLRKMGRQKRKTMAQYGGLGRLQPLICRYAYKREGVEVAKRKRHRENSTWGGQYEASHGPNDPRPLPLRAQCTVCRYDERSRPSRHHIRRVPRKMWMRWQHQQWWAAPAMAAERPRRSVKEMSEVRRYAGLHCEGRRPPAGAETGEEGFYLELSCKEGGRRAAVAVAPKICPGVPRSLTKKRAVRRRTGNEVARDQGISWAVGLRQLARGSRDLVVHIGFEQTLKTFNFAIFRTAP